VSVRLSETGEAREWLSQFREADQPVAQRLLDDLTIVTPSAFMVQMRRLVMRAIGSYQGAVALYPVWEVTPPKIGPLGEVLRRGESIFQLGRPCGFEPTAGESRFELTDPDLRATIPDPIIPVAGSVGTCIQLISTIERERENTFDRPACHVLRAERCRKILLIDDLLGSGKRVTDYLEAFYRHPTIKSWFSYGKLEFLIVCYATTDTALQHLTTYQPRRSRTRPHPVEVTYDQVLFAGRSFWTDVERREIVALCRKYGRHTSRPRMPLGFRSAFSMIVFPHGVPNTAPAILWAGKRGTWRPLFHERTVPIGLLPQLDQLQRDPAGERLAETLLRVNQLRLAGLDWSRHATPAYRKLMLLLGVLSRGFRDEARITEILEVGPDQYRQLLAEAQTLALVTSDQVLTSMGVRELEYARSMRVSPWEAGPLNEGFYVPRSLKNRVRQRPV
jgi:hypothetical protein